MTSAAPVLSTGVSRLAAAALAVTTTTSLLSALALSFDKSAPAEWLVATPEILSAAARCEAHLARGDRLDCKRQLVAQQLKAPHAPQNLAQR